jgi:hypothetical protein
LEVSLTKRLNAAVGLVLLYSLTALKAQQFPWWERLLRYYGGKTDQTPVTSMKMGNHMQMSFKSKPQPGDEQPNKSSPPPAQWLRITPT